MKKKIKTIEKSAVTTQIEFKQLQRIITKVIVFVGYCEWGILIFQCIYLGVKQYYEFICILIVGCLVFWYWLKQLNDCRSTVYEILGLLVMEKECLNCKQFMVCQICHHCQSNLYHYILIELCIDHEQWKQLIKTIASQYLKIIISIIYQTYTVIQIQSNLSKSISQLFQSILIAILLINPILFLLQTLFIWKMYKEKRSKTFVQSSANGFHIIDQEIQAQQEITDQKQQIKEHTPEQQEIEDKGSVNISINEYVSPAMQKLKSSLTPSPGKYRSGKILDFLEKKLSHARLSQKDINYSKEFSKKYNTDQVQNSLDFGDEDDASQFRHKIEKELRNHNFCQQTKFIP